MKNLFVILRKNSNGPTLELLQESCKQRNVSLVCIYTGEFDFSHPVEIPHGDGLYRLSTDPTSSLIEKILLTEHIVSFYKSPLNCIGRLDNVIESTLLHEKMNLPIIKTIYSLSSDRSLLKKYVDALHGFPVILKSTGGQHGVGVMKIESLESLFSIADYLTQLDDGFILREFIDYAEHARLIVLGNKVVSSIEYKRVTDDFRSNVGADLTIVDKKFDPEVERIAVESVSVLGYEFGGVDILIDKKGKPFIAEVNFPCYFPRAQHHTDVDISGLMVDYLLNASLKIS